MGVIFDCLRNQLLTSELISERSIEQTNTWRKNEISRDLEQTGIKH